MHKDLEYQLRKPDASLSDVVDYFWTLTNHATTDHDIVLLPDGRVDLLFSYSPNEPFHVILLGLDSEAHKTTFEAGTAIFGVSFKLPAIEYVFNTHIAHLLNLAEVMPPGFWDISREDLTNFDGFCQKIHHKINRLLQTEIDPRKRKLFNHIYSSHGTLSIRELSDLAGWSSRQINRYFNDHFGLSLKTYCNILRFRASFPQLQEGKLFPEEHFTDQAHFIKEVRKYAGVVPKELHKNKNDRFIQLSALPKK